MSYPREEIGKINILHKVMKNDCECSGLEPIKLELKERRDKMNNIKAEINITKIGEGYIVKVTHKGKDYEEAAGSEHTAYQKIRDILRKINIEINEEKDKKKRKAKLIEELQELE